MKLIYKILVPSIILSVFAIQQYNVRTQHLTTWKGGGFGMYSEIPWIYREVWINGLPDGINPLEGFSYEAACIRQYPTQENMQVIAEKIRNKYNVSALTVEVWEPKYADGTLSRVRIEKLYVR